jgi:hypothetical protein
LNSSFNGKAVLIIIHGGFLKEVEKISEEESAESGKKRKKKFKGIPRETPLKSRWERYLKIWEWSLSEIAVLFLILALIANILVLLNNLL